MNSSKRIICKICFRKNTPLQLIEQLCFYIKGMDKLFCNKYNPSVWHSDIPRLQAYSQAKADKELQRLFKSKKEYLLDAYKHLRKNDDMLPVPRDLHKVEIKIGHFSHGGNLHIRHYFDADDQRTGSQLSRL